MAGTSPISETREIIRNHMNDLRQENEPCGIRLMRLMDARLFDNLLCRIFPENETAVVTHTAYPFPVVMANIPDRALKVYSRSHIFRCDEADYKEFIAEEITPKQYQIWHRKEVQEFL